MNENFYKKPFHKKNIKINDGEENLKQQSSQENLCAPNEITLSEEEIFALATKIFNHRDTLYKKLS